MGKVVDAPESALWNSVSCMVAESAMSGRQRGSQVNGLMGYFFDNQYRLQVFFLSPLPK